MRGGEEEERERRKREAVWCVYQGLVNHIICLAPLFCLSVT